jgi:hypothetical protein
MAETKNLKIKSLAYCEAFYLLNSDFYILLSFHMPHTHPGYLANKPCQQVFVRN